MSNLLSANIDSGLMHSIGLGYHKDLQTRAAFMEVLTKILQQGTEFDTLAENVLADRYDQVRDNSLMTSRKFRTFCRDLECYCDKWGCPPSKFFAKLQTFKTSEDLGIHEFNNISIQILKDFYLDDLHLCYCTRLCLKFCEKIHSVYSSPRGSLENRTK